MQRVDKRPPGVARRAFRRFWYWLDWGPDPDKLIRRHNRLQRITKKNAR